MIRGLLWFEEKAGSLNDAAEAALGRLWLRCRPQARVRKALAAYVRQELRPAE
jgi:hypothetical protein